MNSIYFPAHVVVLFRRLVNVVSTLTISNQYFHLQEKKGTPSEPSRDPSFIIRKVEWPWWTRRGGWGSVISLEDTTVQASTISLPWITKNWWPSVFSSIDQDLQPSSSNSLRTPPPSHPKQTREPSPSPRTPFNPSGDFRRAEALRTLPPDIIHQLIQNPALYDPLRIPRFPIVLCHGLYGFDARGPSSFPSMRMHYWANVLQILRGKVGAEVIVTSVPGTGNIPSRSARLDEQLQSFARGRGVNFLAHSMGGLDCRHLISHIKPVEYAPLSLTTIGTPHRGSPFMDWCVENIGIGKLRQHEREIAYSRSRLNEDDGLYPPLKEPHPAHKQSPTPDASSSFTFSLSSLPSSFTTLLLSIVDSPAYSNLTSAYLNEVFNPATPDDPHVKYFSVAGRMPGVSVWHPFWLPKMVLDGVEEKERTRLKAEAMAQRAQEHELTTNPPLWANERDWGNDGLVTVQSAKWGEFLGIMEGCDHWEMRGARGIEFGVDLPAIPSIGLGSSATYLNNPRHTSQADASVASNRNSWGFREWSRFVSGWKRDEKDSLEQNHALATSSPGKESDPNSDSKQALRQSTKHREAVKRERARAKDDDVVRSSTDKISLVFDWLIESIPAPHVLLGGGSGNGSAASDVKGEMKASQDLVPDTVNQTQKMAAEMVTHSVAGGRGSAFGPTEEERREVQRKVNGTTGATSEMKKRMDRETKGRKENELSSKDDLERFYVALSRKMWDEGL